MLENILWFILESSVLVCIAAFVVGYFERR